MNHHVDDVLLFRDGNRAIQWVNIKKNTEIEMETLSQKLVFEAWTLVLKRIPIWSESYRNFCCHSPQSIQFDSRSFNLSIFHSLIVAKSCIISYKSWSWKLITNHQRFILHGLLRAHVEDKRWPQIAACTFADMAIEERPVKFDVVPFPFSS